MRYRSITLSQVVTFVCVKRIEAIGLVNFVLRRTGIKKKKVGEKRETVGQNEPLLRGKKNRTIRDVSRDRCMGCGLCYSLCPSNAISISEDTLSFVPVLDEKSCTRCGKCYRSCPGVNVKGYRGTLGDIETIYVAHAKNLKTRYDSSSGGVCRSILAALLEGKVVDKVIVTRATDDPYRPETIVTSSIEELFSERLNSIYSPTSPLAALKDLDDNLRYAFVGLPCHIAGICLSESLMDKIYVKIGIFCSHTPNFKFVDAFLRDLPKDRKVPRLNYRGEGWPGRTTVHFSDGERYGIWFPAMWHKYNEDKRFQLPRCGSCTYYSAEFADISIGDPWNLVRQDKNGSSLVFVRTSRGKECMDVAAQRINAYEVASDKKESILEFHKDSVKRKKRADFELS